MASANKFKGVLGREKYGVMEFIHPVSYTDITVYDDKHSVYDKFIALLENKVDTEDNKTLSTNNFTTELKNKLDSIEANANKYILPQADMITLGGAKIGYEENGQNYAVKVTEEGDAYVTVPWAYTEGPAQYTLATSTKDGLMSKEDKAKLDGIQEKANRSYIDKRNGGIILGYNENNWWPWFNYAVKMDRENRLYVHIPWQDMQENINIKLATRTKRGLMSKEDKVRLNNMENGANNYKHETYPLKIGAPTINQIPTFGDIITTSSHITTDETGHITSITSCKYKFKDDLATGFENGLMSKEDYTALDTIINSGLM